MEMYYYQTPDSTLWPCSGSGEPTDHDIRDMGLRRGDVVVLLSEDVEQYEDVSRIMAGHSMPQVVIRTRHTEKYTRLTAWRWNGKEFKAVR